MGRRFRIQIVFNLFVILALSVVSTVFALKPGGVLITIATGLLGLFLSVMFYRFLVQSKEDLRQFLLSFQLENPGSMGTSRILRHSKDDLNSAYHQLQRTIENHVIEKTGELEFYREAFDVLQAGLMVVNAHDDIVLINRFTKNLLFHPELKNMTGLARLNPDLAEFLNRLIPGSSDTLQIMIENEPREFLVFSMEMKYQESAYRVFTLENIKKEVRDSELIAWTQMGEILEKRLNEGGFNIKQAIGDFNVEVKYSPVKIILSEFLNKVVKQSVKQLNLGEDLFSIQLSNIDLSVVADEKALLDIFLAILKNSSEAMSTQKKPSLELKAELDLSCRVQLLVSDNGEGIPPEILNWVFVPFFSTREGHAGLGLSMARRYMSEMKGSIDLISEPGKGSTAILRFM